MYRINDWNDIRTCFMAFQQAGTSKPETIALQTHWASHKFQYNGILSMHISKLNVE